MAGATGINDSSKPIRIMPPAIPKTPEMNEVDSTEAASAAAKGTLIMATSMNSMCLHRGFDSARANGFN